MPWDDERERGFEAPTLFCPKCEQKTVYLIQRVDEVSVQCCNPDCRYAYLVAPEAVP